MIEYIKFHCKVLEKKEVGKKTPEILMAEYLSKRKDGVDLNISGVECIVESVKYTSGRTSIITKLLRIMDLENEESEDTENILPE